MIAMNDVKLKENILGNRIDVFEVDVDAKEKSSIVHKST